MRHWYITVILMIFLIKIKRVSSRSMSHYVMRFQFQPDWPALDNLAIDLNFLNEGLWMNAPHTLLGKVIGSNISAIIPDYLKENCMSMRMSWVKGAMFMTTLPRHHLRIRWPKRWMNCRWVEKLVGAYTWISRWKKRASPCQR